MKNNRKYEIIDCHIHPFLSKKNNFEFFSSSSNADRFVELLKKAGIDRACGSVIERLEKPEFKDIRRLNNECYRFRDRYPDFFIPGIHVHPDYPDESCAEIERARDNGVKWIGELVGYMMGYSTYISKNCFDIFKFANGLKMPVNIHLFKNEEAVEICKAFPDLTLVIAHPGAGKIDIRDRVELISKFKNLYLDISGSGPNRWGMLRYAIDVAGKNKILFGTDFPLCNPAMYVSGVDFELLDEKEKEAVFSGNFKRLTGVK
jgi:predicted TIM-barrel fold metal-dependent hydrolase